MITPATPESVRDSLERSEWGYSVTNSKITSVFCTMCGASVPYGNYDDPSNSDAKKFHIEFHVTQHRILFSMQEQINDLKKELQDARQPDPS